MKPRDIKILVFSTILVLFGVLCYFLSLRTLNALVNNPDLLGRLDYHSARRYYWASLAVLTISSVPFVGILLSDRYPLSKHLTRGDMYFLIIVSRLILIIILEYFYIQVYMDLPYYLAYPVSQFEGTSFAPLSVACYSFLRFQQEIVFRWHGSPFLPGQELYLPLLLRINNLVLEIICIYIIEKIYRDYVQKKGQKPLKDRISGDIKSKNHEDINILFYFLVFPITLLISYVWVTVDLFLVLLMLWAIWESYKNHDVRSGLALGFVFLMKFVGVLFIIPYIFNFLKKREIKRVLKIGLPFCLIAFGGYYLFHSLVENQPFIQFFYEKWILRKGTDYIPIFHNIWLVIQEVYLPIVFIMTLIGAYFILFYSAKTKNVGIQSYVVIFAILNLCFFATSPWWVVISGFFIPFFLLLPSRKINKDAFLSLVFSLGYLLLFTIVCMITLTWEPDYGVYSLPVPGRLIIRSWPNSLWLIPTTVCFMMWHFFSIKMGLNSSIERFSFRYEVQSPQNGDILIL